LFQIIEWLCEQFQGNAMHGTSPTLMTVTHEHIGRNANDNSSSIP